MSVKERRRLEVFGRVAEGAISVAKAAELLGLSDRQAWRVKARYRREREAGLVHRLRGRASNRRGDPAVREAVLALCRAKYAGFGATLACEYLAREDGHRVSHDTLGRWLRAAGLWAPQRKRDRHRRRRERRAHAGELVQMDGSWHDWFEGRGPWCCLMVLVDDATGRTSCRFYDRETSGAAFDVFGRYARAFGLPRALYVDRAGIYREEGEATVTQFGRAMGELEVGLILAGSPQAKGRVERKNATLQDRLVKAMRLAGVGGIDAANRFLEDTPFLAELNGRFAVAPRRKADVHRRVPRGVSLARVLCVQEERAVGRDWCVQWRGRVLQVDAAHAAMGLSRAGRRVQVTEQLDGTLHVTYGGQDLRWREVSERPPKRPRPRARKPVVNNKRWTPPPQHPWKASASCVSRRGALVGSASSAPAAGQ